MAEQKKINSPAIWTPICRVAFPSLIEPSAYLDKGDKVYSVTLIFPEPELLNDMRTLAKKVAVQEFPNGLPDGFWSPFRKCEEKADKNYKGFEPGHMFLKAKAGQNVTIAYAHRDRTPAEASNFYGGCWAIANVHFWPYKQGANTGLSVRLNGMQFVKDGEKFAGRNVDFQDLGVDEGAFDNSESETDFL